MTRSKRIDVDYIDKAESREWKPVIFSYAVVLPLVVFVNVAGGVSKQYQVGTNFCVCTILCQE